MAYQGNYPPSTPLTSSQIAAGAVQPSNLSTQGPYWDGSGNVGIGTASPIQLLTLESTSNIRSTIRNSTENTSYACSLDFATGSGSLSSTNVVGRVIGLVTQADPSTLQSALTFHTNGGDSVAERMRIDSSGNVLVGTTANAAGNRLAVVGGGIQLSGGTTAQEGIRIQRSSGVASFTGINNDNNTYNALSFFTGASEAARIDTSGNLLVGATSSVGTKFYVTSSGDASFFNTTGTTSTCSYWRVGGNTSAYYQLFQNASGSNIGWIRTTDGSTVQYFTGSDERLKENIAASPTALSKISELKVRSYDWKATGNHVDYGFIAQEVVQTIPDAVSVGKDKEDGSIDVPWGVDYAKLVPALVAAIQELSAKNDALEARLATLEAK